MNSLPHFSQTAKEVYHGAKLYASLNSFACEFTPNDGYKFTTWLYNEAEVGVDLKPISNINENQLVTGETVPEGFGSRSAMGFLCGYI